LSHLFTVGFGVQGSFSEEYGMFFRGDTEFVVEGVVPVIIIVFTRWAIK
jgi:hypothetical protein